MNKQNNIKYQYRLVSELVRFSTFDWYFCIYYNTITSHELEIENIVQYRGSLSNK